MRFQWLGISALGWLAGKRTANSVTKLIWVYSPDGAEGFMQARAGVAAGLLPHGNRGWAACLWTSLNSSHRFVQGNDFPLAVSPQPFRCFRPLAGSGIRQNLYLGYLHWVRDSHRSGATEITSPTFPTLWVAHLQASGQTRHGTGFSGCAGTPF